MAACPTPSTLARPIPSWSPSSSTAPRPRYSRSTLKSSTKLPPPADAGDPGRPPVYTATAGLDLVPSWRGSYGGLFVKCILHRSCSIGVERWRSATLGGPFGSDLSVGKLVSGGTC